MWMLLVSIVVAHAADWPTDEADPAPWTTTPTGVEIQDRVVGTGKEAVPHAGAIVNYTGMLSDGAIFDSSIPRGTPFSFRLGAEQVIPGWDEGVVGMKVGGVRRLVIPPAMGYGDRAVGNIPANAVLYFEVELVDVLPPRIAPDAPSPVPEGSWTALASGVRFADLTVGTGGRAKAGDRVCIDYVAWKGGQPLEHTYTRSRCTWIRLADDNLPAELEQGLAKMRVGGQRQISVPPDLVYQVELTDTGK